MTLPVTVLLPVFNGEQWLGDSIESVLNQSFQGYELLIVNDGSLDNSLTIAASYAKQDSRIRIIDKTNTGLSDSLNAGISLAKGNWIARLDTDDICEPERLWEQYDFACGKPKTVVVGSGHVEINELGQTGRIHKYPASHRELVRSMLRRKRIFSHSSAFIRREALLSLSGYRSQIVRSQDFDLWLRMSEIGELACINRPLVRIRRHSGQLSNQDEGKAQLIYSRVALVSYTLRQFGFPDPVSIEYNNNDFLDFYDFIERGVTGDKLFEYHKFVSHLKTFRYSPKERNTLLVKCLSLESLAFILRFFWERFGCESLARRLAHQWMKEFRCVD